jgi:D-mannonate dehydratase
MSEMIAYCGLDCNECKAFKATQAKDYEQKMQIARHWSDQGEIKFKPEDVDCHGCKSDLISGFCRKLCEIRPCAEEKKVRTCAHCDDYPCEKLKEYLSDNDPVATENLEKIRKTL